MPSTRQTMRGTKGRTGTGTRRSNRGSRAGQGGRKAAGRAPVRGRRPGGVARRPGGQVRREAASQPPDPAKVETLLYQALETERGGIQVYEAALRCVQDEELRGEWEAYLEQTREHERILLGVFDQMGLDRERETPGRQVVRAIGESLVHAMEIALEEGEPEAAESVAAECIVLAETKDHLNWELIGEVARAMPEEEGRPLREAYELVEDEEDEHLYHTQGWARELWMKGLGLPAVLPPPEEARDVKSAIEAARAKASRKKMRATA